MKRVSTIPAILAKNEADFRRDWKRVKGVARSLHLDVGDGKFVKTRTWADPDVIRRLHIPGLEVHFMTTWSDLPAGRQGRDTWSDRTLSKWVKAGARSVILHVEAIDTHPHPTSPLKGEELKSSKQRIPLPLGERMKVRGGRVEIGLAINPETSVTRLKPFLKLIDFVLVMSVVPGAQGRPFDRRALGKIRALRRRYPRLEIAVDGGLNERTIPAVVKAGADRLVVGSAIVNAENPIVQLKTLARLAAY